MIWAAALLLAAGGIILPARAQNKPPLEYQVKAAFLFNFTRFVHWPASAYASSEASFVIGIVGNDPFGSYLDDLVKGEQAEGHPIIVRRYPDGEDLRGCQLVFINFSAPDKIKAALSLTAQQNILTVSDMSNFISVGGMVRFFKADNRVKIEIKLSATKTARLEISSKMLQVAKVK